MDIIVMWWHGASIIPGESIACYNFQQLPIFAMTDKELECEDASSQE